MPLLQRPGTYILGGIVSHNTRAHEHGSYPSSVIIGGLGCHI